MSAYYMLFTYGPKFMESRKPFELKTIMTLYNFLQVVLNTYFAFEVSKFIIQFDKSFDF
jgi:GNS1/SUR4 family